MLTEQGQRIGRDAVVRVSIQIFDCIELAPTWMDQVNTVNQIRMKRVKTSLVLEIALARIQGFNKLRLHLLDDENWHLRCNLAGGDNCLRLAIRAECIIREKSPLTDIT